jgi:hypothetical protein
MGLAYITLYLFRGILEDFPLGKIWGFLSENLNFLGDFKKMNSTWQLC